VYDLLGREVAVLVNGEMSAGAHETNWNAASMPSGVYVYRLETTGIDGQRLVESKRMILMK
jgi:hypothetical protein